MSIYNNTIYFGDMNYLKALYANETISLLYQTENDTIVSTPIVYNDSSIFFVVAFTLENTLFIYRLYPNGSCDTSFWNDTDGCGISIDNPGQMLLYGGYLWFTGYSTVNGASFVTRISPIDGSSVCKLNWDSTALYTGMAIISTGTMYIVSKNSQILEYDFTSNLYSIYAGSTIKVGFNGIGTGAGFKLIRSITAISGDHILVADRSQIRIIMNSTIVVTTIAGYTEFGSYEGSTLLVNIANTVVIFEDRYNNYIFSDTLVATPNGGYMWKKIIMKPIAGTIMVIFIEWDGVYLTLLFTDAIAYNISYIGPSLATSLNSNGKSVCSLSCIATLGYTARYYGFKRPNGLILTGISWSSISSGFITFPAYMLYYPLAASPYSQTSTYNVSIRQIDLPIVNVSGTFASTSMPIIQKAYITVTGVELVILFNNQIQLVDSSKIACSSILGNFNQYGKAIFNDSCNITINDTFIILSPLTQLGYMDQVIVLGNTIALSGSIVSTMNTTIITVNVTSSPFVHLTENTSYTVASPLSPVVHVTGNTSYTVGCYVNCPINLEFTLDTSDWLSINVTVTNSAGLPVPVLSNQLAINNVTSGLVYHSSAVFSNLMNLNINISVTNVLGLSAGIVLLVNQNISILSEATPDGTSLNITFGQPMKILTGNLSCSNLISVTSPMVFMNPCSGKLSLDGMNLLIKSIGWLNPGISYTLLGGKFRLAADNYTFMTDTVLQLGMPQIVMQPQFCVFAYAG
jgi:hypothetical protein